MLSKENINQIEERGLTKRDIKLQLQKFRDGFPQLDVVAAATPLNGIVVLSKEEQSFYVEEYSKFEDALYNFIPASGAATRMFKELFEALNSLIEGREALSKGVEEFFENLERYPFYEELSKLCNLKKNETLSSSQKRELLEVLLTDKGINYGYLPKGLLKFHRYGSYTRTALEEHLYESSLYATDKKGEARLLFTVSPEHLELFKKLVDRVKPFYEKRYNYSLDISFTIQKPSTDTIAVDLENNPFKDKEGKLLFRPAGHGALIDNLNEIDANLIIIKNIDNVTREERVADTVWWKKVLCALLLDVQKRLFHYLRELESSRCDSLIAEIKGFLKEKFAIELPNVNKEIEGEFIRELLNRPLRVCGMIKNLGEPGGGPFLVRDTDGTLSLQILESAQLDMDDREMAKIFESSTHFNPVDIVCGVKDYRGNKFDLKNYIDHQTGFISHKSFKGEPIKALELPGLWNGAMSRWNTIFVEVPVTTFTPVKRVFDLLREEHQDFEQ